ncbi:MAG: acyl carrier protein [Bacteroidia bacterium]|nr:acyl carrier protein [Bacteroidia bacterium]
MTIQEFTQLLEKEFEDLTPGTLTPQTNYRDIPNWSSMHALIIIAFVDANFGVELTASDLRSTQTIEDLYTIIQSKLSQ